MNFWRPRLVVLVLLLASGIGGQEEERRKSTTLTMGSGAPSKDRRPPLPLPPAPWSIAHRGASGLIPEHTMASYQLAVEEGVDFIECDAIYTKDCELICRHDADLTKSTDAAQKFPEKTRKSPVEIDGVSFENGVFASDLTLAEVRRLRARQAKADSLGRSKEFDGLFGLVTLDEFASYAAGVAADGGRRWNDSGSSLSPRVVGVHVEAKHPSWHSRTLPKCARDPASMVEHVAGVLGKHGFATLSTSDKNDFARDPLWLRAPTFLQCFEPGALEVASRRGGATAPLVQLVDDASVAVPGRGENATFADLVSDAGLERLSEFAHAIGPSVSAVLDPGSSLAKRAKERGLALHAWTLRDDKVNVERFARERGGALKEAEAVFGVAEAAFGDFPATVVRAAEEERGRGGGRVARRSVSGVRRER